MPDLLEAVTNVMKMLVDDEPKAPLTVLEVGHCWTYLAFLEDALGISQIALNTTTNDALSKAIHEELELIQIQMTRLREFLVDEGVPLPAASEQKPKCRSEEIPPGAKKTDSEIANALSLKIASATVACATAVAQTIRVDVSLMFTQFLGQKLIYGATLRTLMRKHGWIKVPPYYEPPGRPS